MQVTDSKNSGGRLYRSAGAKHPDAVPTPRGRKAVNADRFDFLETTKPGRIATDEEALSPAAGLPGEVGLRGWQLFLLVTAATLVTSFAESAFSKGSTTATQIVFVLASVLGAYKTRAESNYATWTTPPLAFGFVSLTAALTKFSAAAGVIGNVGTVAVEFFTRLSAGMFPVLGATVVGWILGRRTLVAYRAARYRLERRRVRD